MNDIRMLMLDHVMPQMRLYAEERFGPVKPIVRVDGVDAAVARANDNAYGHGYFGGKAGIEAFTELRWITLRTTPRHDPF